MNELEIKYKQKFRNKLRWYKEDQGSPLLDCIIDDFDSIIKDIFLELEKLNNKTCKTCTHFTTYKGEFGACKLCFNNSRVDLLHNSFCCNAFELAKMSK